MKKNNFLAFNSFIKVFFGAAACCILATSTTFAQSVSDDELRKYAVVMDSIDAMKLNIQDDYNAMIQEEESMQGGRRFVEIQQVGDDSVRLSELNVTEMELETFNKIQQKYAEMTSEFKENYTNLIKEDLGAALYNKVNKALKDDSEVKNRYDSILEEVKAEGSSDTDDTGQVTEPGQQDNTDMEMDTDETSGTTPTEDTTMPTDQSTYPADTTETDDATTPMDSDMNETEQMDPPVDNPEVPENTETEGVEEDL
ncbi:MAG: hypothetical protein M3421_06060 [Bacteroidota bacterium]|nr:hypothetical protein [Bacteroidota bacterium]